jgi:hypothetical protein
MLTAFLRFYYGYITFKEDVFKSGWTILVLEIKNMIFNHWE